MTFSKYGLPMEGIEQLSEEKKKEWIEMNNQKIEEEKKSDREYLFLVRKFAQSYRVNIDQNKEKSFDLFIAAMLDKYKNPILDDHGFPVLDNRIDSHDWVVWMQALGDFKNNEKKEDKDEKFQGGEDVAMGVSYRE